MKRLFLICLVIALQFQILPAYAENLTNEQYVLENRLLRKNIIDLKHDFYSFKVQQEKLAQLQGRQITGNNYGWFFVTLICLSLFLFWHILRNLRLPLKQLADQKMNKFFQNQIELLSDVEKKIRTNSVNKTDQSVKFLEGFIFSLEELLRKDPKNDKYLYEKAEIEAYLGKRVSALQDLREATEINPKWKKTAKESDCFKKIRNFVEFKKIVGEGA